MNKKRDNSKNGKRIKMLETMTVNFQFNNYFKQFIARFN